MTETVEIGGTCDLICNLKAAVTALECQHNMNMVKKQTRRKECKKPSPPPMFVMIPLEQQMHGDNGSIFEDGIKRRRRKNDFIKSESSESIASSIGSSRGHHQTDGCNDSEKGPGVRGGVLHSRCFCIHRDGLQDYCPLTECQNDPDCMKKPPHCAPARYFHSRFPENYP